MTSLSAIGLQDTKNPAIGITQSVVRLPDYSGSRVTGEQVPHRAEDLGMAMLNARPGSIAPRQAVKLFHDWLATSNFLESANALLSSTNEVERGFAAFAILEKQGLTAELDQLAISDNSMHVRSTIFSWLFAKRDFTSIRKLIENDSRTKEAINQLVQLVVSGRQIPTPLPMARLGGYQRHLAILAMHDPSVAPIITRELRNNLITDSGKSKLLEILAIAHTDSYKTDLWQTFKEQANSSARILTAQYIAAITPENNTKDRESLMLAMPTPVPGIGPTHLLFQEERKEQLRKLESDLMTLIQTDPQSLARGEHLAKIYLKTLHMVGTDNLSTETFKALSYLITHNEEESSDIFAEASFILAEVQKNNHRN